MKKIDNQGVSFILFTVILGMILLGLVTAVFTGMYSASDKARRLRSGLNSQLILQQLGVEALRAYRQWEILGNGCGGAGTIQNNYAGNVSFCFPDPVCIPNPISADQAHLLCDDNATPIFELMDVKAGMDASIDIEMSIKNKYKYLLAQLNNWPGQLLIYLSKKLNYFSDKSYAEIIIPVDFSGAAAGSALDDSCAGTRCKTCGEVGTTATELTCMRFRVCPHYGGCNAAVDAEWVVQKVGILTDPASP